MTLRSKELFQRRRRTVVQSAVEHQVFRVPHFSLQRISIAETASLMPAVAPLRPSPQALKAAEVKPVI
jgi:hypothetical protein